MSSNYLRIAPILCRQLSVVPRRCVSATPTRFFWHHRPWNSLVDLSPSFQLVESRMRELEREMDKIMFRSFPRSLRRRDDGDMAATPVNVEVVRDGKNRKLEVRLNLGNFKPEDVKISIKDKMLTVHARKEVVDGSAKTVQEYYRQFDLPEDVDLESLKSLMSPDGVLRVEGTLPQVEVGETKEIPIQKESLSTEKKVL